MSTPQTASSLRHKHLTALTWDQAVCHYVMVGADGSVTLCLESHDGSAASLRLDSGQEVSPVTRIEVRLDLWGAGSLDWASALSGPQNVRLRPTSDKSDNSLELLVLLVQGPSSSLRLSARWCTIQAVILGRAG